MGAPASTIPIAILKSLEHWGSKCKKSCRKGINYLRFDSRNTFKEVQYRLKV